MDWSKKKKYSKLYVLVPLMVFALLFLFYFWYIGKFILETIGITFLIQIVILMLLGYAVLRLRIVYKEQTK